MEIFILQYYFMAFPFQLKFALQWHMEVETLDSPVGQPQCEELEARRLEEEVGVGFAQLADAGDPVAEPPDHLN